MGSIDDAPVHSADGARATQCCVRGIRAGCAVHTATGMGAGTCQVDAVDRCLGTAEARYRTEHQLLIDVRRSPRDCAPNEIVIGRL